MFTGIIREIGAVASVGRKDGVVRLSIAAPQTAARVQRLESVSVNGVCLSVVEIRPPLLAFEVIRETHRLTTLGELRAGHRVNLEPSLSLSDRLGGQLLFGHIDGVGTIAQRRQHAGEVEVRIRLAPRLLRYLVSRGPVAVDGVSLTVAQALTGSTFTVHLIPETRRQTTLDSLILGTRVNVELDYFAKLVRQFLTRRRSSEGALRD